VWNEGSFYEEYTDTTCTADEVIEVPADCAKRVLPIA
jgi:hypothetical protein